MSTAVSLVRGENVAEMTAGRLTIHSVLIVAIPPTTQNQGPPRSVVLGNLKEKMVERFLSLNETRWHVWDFLPSDSYSLKGEYQDNVLPAYDPRAVRAQNGFLQLLVSRNTSTDNETYVTTARVDGTVRVLHGTTEWSARINRAIDGVTYWLQLILEECIPNSFEHQRFTTNVSSVISPSDQR